MSSDHTSAGLKAVAIVAGVLVLGGGVVLVGFVVQANRRGAAAEVARQDMPKPVQGKTMAQAEPKPRPDSDKEWTWQDLQDHIAKKGWKTSRGIGRLGMWFKDGDGSPLPSYEILDKDKAWSGWALGAGWFYADEHVSTALAREQATRLKDVHQTDVLAWNRFTFHGSAATRARLKALLP